MLQHIGTTLIGRRSVRCRALFRWPRETLLWKQSFSFSSENGGLNPLFGLEGLRKPDDFMALARKAVLDTDAVRESLKATDSFSPSETLVKLDEISNTVCRVIDVAEFCRSVHHDPEFREAAEQAFMHLAEYIQLLNMDTALYKTLCNITDDEDKMKNLDEEEQRMAVLLKAEFERDGIHLPEGEREIVSQLQNNITRIETIFNQNIINLQSSVQVPSSVLRKTLSEDFLSQIPQPPGQPRDLFALPTHNHISNTILKYIPDGHVRKQMYIAANTATQPNVEVLEELVRQRHRLARRLGFPSHAHRFLADKLLRRPGAVRAFLGRLSAAARPKSAAELARVADAKWAREADRAVRPWDLPHYTAALKAQEHGLDGWGVAEYLSLEHCLGGLRLVCRDLFGIELREVPLGPEEDWGPPPGTGSVAPAVRKLTLHHPEEGALGCIYLDLHPRPGKYTHAAHFTLRCGFAGQLPIVALVCNFSRDNATDGNGCPVSLLSHGEAETLFHEWGHALHSVLSRTRFQHLSGTRGPLDFVEIPSHLMEHFVWDPRVLRRFAKHYRTGAPIPDALVRQLLRSKTAFAGTDAQTQILYALLDQKFFGPHDSVDRLPLTKIAASLQEEVTGVPAAAGTYWFARFGHFTGYGAGYYGYLYARAAAAALWASHHRRDPFCRASGERLWKGLLAHGNARDPAKLLRAALALDGGDLDDPGAAAAAAEGGGGGDGGGGELEEEGEGELGLGPRGEALLYRSFSEELAPGGGAAAAGGGERGAAAAEGDERKIRLS